MPIGILELLAAILALLTFAPLIRDAGVAVLDTDSLSTAFQLTEETTRTMLGQFLLSQLYDTAEFAEVRPLVHVRHVWGPTNMFSDILSRAGDNELRLLAAQLRVRLSEVPPPQVFLRIFNRFTALVQRRPEAPPLAPRFDRAHGMRATPHAAPSPSVTQDDTEPVIGSSSSGFLDQEIIQYMDAEERALFDELHKPFPRLRSLENAGGLTDWLNAAPVASRHLAYTTLRLLECNEIVTLPSERELNQFLSTSIERHNLMCGWVKDTIPSELWAFYADDREYPTASDQALLMAAMAQQLDGAPAALPAHLVSLLRNKHALTHVREVTDPAQRAIEEEQARAKRTRNHLATYKRWVQGAQNHCFQLGKTLTLLDLIRTCTFRGCQQVLDQGGMKSAIGVYFLDMALFSAATAADIGLGILKTSALRHPEARLVRPIRIPPPASERVVDFEQSFPASYPDELPTPEQQMQPFSWFELPSSENADPHAPQLRKWLRSAHSMSALWLAPLHQARLELVALSRAQEALQHFYVDRYNAHLCDKRRLLLILGRLGLRPHEREELDHDVKELLRIARLRELLQDWQSDRLQSEHLLTALEVVLRALSKSIPAAGGPVDTSPHWLKCFGPLTTPPSGPVRLSHKLFAPATTAAVGDSELDALALAAESLEGPRLGFLARRQHQVGVTDHELALQWPLTPTNWKAAPPSPSLLHNATVLPHIVTSVADTTAMPMQAPRRVRARLLGPSHPPVAATATHVPSASSGAAPVVVDSLPTAFPMLQSTITSVISDLGSLRDLRPASRQLVERSCSSLSALQRAMFDWAGGFNASTESINGVDPHARRMMGRIPPGPYVPFGDEERHAHVSTATNPHPGAFQCGFCDRDLSSLEAQCVCEGPLRQDRSPSQPIAPLGPPPASSPPSPAGADSPEHPPDTRVTHSPAPYVPAHDHGAHRLVRVCVLVSQPMQCSYAQWTRSFNYWATSLKDVFRDLIELHNVGHRNTHVLVLDESCFMSLEYTLAQACTLANVAHLDLLRCGGPSLQLYFELFALEQLAQHQLRCHPPPTDSPASRDDADGRLTRNAAVRARSRHATSVHLGNAADSVAQADFAMADASTTARIDLFDEAVTALASAARHGIESDRAARTLGVLLGDQRMRRAGLRSIKAVVYSWHNPEAYPLVMHLRQEFRCTKSNFESWRKRLTALRLSLEDERAVLSSALDCLVEDDAACSNDTPRPAVGPSSSSPLAQEQIRYMRAAIRAAQGLDPPSPAPHDSPSAPSDPRCPPGRAARGKRPLTSEPPPPLHTDELVAQQRSHQVRRLQEDNSSGALHLTNEQADWFTAQLGDAESAGVNRDTAKRDDSSWRRYWIPIITTLGTAPIRDYPAAVSGTDAGLRFRETMLLVYVLIMILTMMSPRSRSAPAPQVSSALHVLLGVRRIHNRMHIDMVPFRLIKVALRGLTMRFIELHGHEALLPKRKAPLQHATFIALLNVQSGTLESLQYAGLLYLSTQAVMCLLWASGFRKAELVAAAYYLRHGSLVWCLVLNGGSATVVSTPSAQQLLAAQPGSYVEVWPRMSKCDVTGAVWGDKKTFHSLSSRPGNCFSALRALTIGVMQRTSISEDTPLFIDDDLNLMTASKAQRLLHALLVASHNAHLTPILSWHSFRISLATRLGRANCPPDKIQALCRWQSPASLLIYRRLGLDDYQQWIEGPAFDADFDTGTVLTTCIESTAGLLALTRANPAQNDAGPSSPSPARTLHSPARTLPTPAPTAVLPALTMRNAVGRAVIVPILQGWEHYPCNENGGRGWSARIVATRAGRRVSVRFTDARDTAGLKYPNETLPLDVLLELQAQPHSS